MTNNIVVVDTKTRFVTVSNPLIGNKGENRVTRLVMNMSEFLNGNAFLEIRRPDPNDMTQTITQYAQMEKGEKNYSIVVLNSILQVEGEIELCFHIYNESMFEGGCACEIFKSSIFKMIVGETIDAENDEIEEYPDVFGELLAKIDGAIADIKVINEIIASGSLAGKVVKDIVYDEKDSVPGVVDIYTILYTDNTSSSLSIKYGEQYDDSELKREIAEIKIDYVKKDNFTSMETDPTVPSWAKQATKPTYTADEVGALPNTTVIPTKTSQLENDSGFITDTTGVESVNGKKGIVELTAEDVGALPADTTIPTKTSELTNDSGFITDVPVKSVNSKIGNVTLNADDVGALPSNTKIPTKTSDLQNDSGFITAAPVDSVNGKTGAVVLNANDVGALPSTTKIPQNTMDLTNNNMVQYTAQVLNDTQKEQARQNIGAGTSNFSGSYNDLTDKPDTPGTYELPIASATTLGGVKIGNYLEIDNNGILSVDITYNDLEDKPVIVTQLTSAATDNELVSAKCLYDIIGNVETQLASI